MDVKKLLTALDDETNENLLNFTTKNIEVIVKLVIQKMRKK